MLKDEALINALGHNEADSGSKTLKEETVMSMISRRSFVSSAAAIGATAGAIALAGCSGGSSSGSASTSSASASNSTEAASQVQSGSASGQHTADLGKSVVVFFSRAGENFDVGVIDEGNTSIVAHSIAGKVVSDVFEIVPAEEYPFGYDDCYAKAKAEQNANARPEISDPFDSFDEYDTVYLGYPIWHSDLPMIMLTFVESKDWTGKNVMPFCTHGDSGLCGTDSHLKQICKGADVKEGLAIKGSDAQAFGMDVDKAINTWLAKVRS